MRRLAVERLSASRARPREVTLLPEERTAELFAFGEIPDANTAPDISVLVRNHGQFERAVEARVRTLYCEFEDPKRYRAAVQFVRREAGPETSIWVAPPRIS